MKVLISTFLLFFACAAYATEPGAEENLAEVLAVRTYVVPDKHDPPRYPLKALRSGIEGWIVVRFTITEDGTTADITIDDASIDGYFEKEIIRTVGAWTYAPATLNGVPVSQYNQQSRHIFRIKNQPGGVSPEFHARYKAARAATRSGDLEHAGELIKELDSNKKRLLAEVCYLDVLKAVYWQKMDNQQRATRHIERALVIADEVVPPDMYLGLLRQAITAHSTAGNYGRALEHYETLQKADKDLSAQDPVHDLISQVKAILNGDKAIAVEGRLKLCNHCKPVRASWRHRLNRRSFSIDQVEGEISAIEVICDLKSTTLVYTPQTVFHIKKDWNSCDARLIGKRGTSFRLIEHPSQAAPGAS